MKRKEDMSHDRQNELTRSGDPGVYSCILIISDIPPSKKEVVKTVILGLAWKVVRTLLVNNETTGDGGDPWFLTELCPWKTSSEACKIARRRALFYVIT
jgi:hypothetical protein